jgi:quercetin dioxygenase-like cupin family protein
MYLLNAFWFILRDGSTVHIYPQTIHGTAQLENTERNIHNNKNT